MNTKSVKFVDKHGNMVAAAHVIDEGEHFGGTIDPASMSASTRAIFDEFEDIVNNQMFSFLDDVHAKIGSLSIRAIFPDENQFGISDLQIYPSTGEVSFKLAPVPAPVG